MSKLKHFNYWCQKVLPLVYDDSLSYYETLCKVVDYINNSIQDQVDFTTEIEELKKELAVVQSWIDNFDPVFIEEQIKEYIPKIIKNVTFGISTGGYFMAIIPQSWTEIEFGTIQTGELYGHLTLQYD